MSKNILNSVFDLIDYLKSGELYKLIDACDKILKENKEEIEKYQHAEIEAGIRNIIYSIRNILVTDMKEREDKVEFELEPLIREVAFGAYYFIQAAASPKRLNEFYDSDYFTLTENMYFKSFDVSIVVLAYNRLFYTQLCVQSILDNLPSKYTYEIILINNGSTDGTKEYFEEVKNTNPNIRIKTINLLINSLANAKLYSRIVEGKYVLSVNNDVILTPKSIDYLIDGMNKDKDIGMSVPVVTNVSNGQAIDLKYESYDQIQKYGANWNSEMQCMIDMYRLVNPIAIMRSSALRVVGEHDPCFVYGFFSDDALSKRMKERNYRLAINASVFCYHFGSMTLGQDENFSKKIFESRKIFWERFGVDAWELCENAPPLFGK